MGAQQPAVARIVHYVSYGTPGGEYQSKCRAAVITALPEVAPPGDCVSLAVLNPTGMFFNEYVRHDEGVPSFLTEPQEPVLCGDLVYPGGTWHWPART